MPLAAYCQSFGIWRAALEALAYDPGLVGADDRPNPLIRIARDAARDMVRFSSEFGMTPAARTRLAGGIFEPSDTKWAGLLP
jgi:P27 family predicted phage terminase small subunit